MNEWFVVDYLWLLSFFCGWFLTSYAFFFTSSALFFITSSSLVWRVILIRSLDSTLRSFRRISYIKSTATLGVLDFVS